MGRLEQSESERGCCREGLGSQAGPPLLRGPLVDHGPDSTLCSEDDGKTPEVGAEEA